MPVLEVIRTTVLYALVSTLPLSEYERYYFVSRNFSLTAAFPVYRFFFDIDHILLTITSKSRVKHEYVNPQNLHSLDRLWTHNFYLTCPDWT